MPLVYRPRLPLRAVHALPLHAWEAMGAQPGPGTQGAPCPNHPAPKDAVAPTLLRTRPERGLTASIRVKAGPHHPLLTALLAFTPRPCGGSRVCRVGVRGVGGGHLAPQLPSWEALGSSLGLSEPQCVHL